MTPLELKEARTAMGWTQGALGKALETTGRTIRRLEAGRSEIPPWLAAKVMRLADEGLAGRLAHLKLAIEALKQAEGALNTAGALAAKGLTTKAVASAIGLRAELRLLARSQARQAAPDPGPQPGPGDTHSPVLLGS
jgi:DNA-binding XRE family transcriptional regulator